MDDQKIIALFWARNEQALSESEKKYEKYCRYIAHRILGNEEDTAEIVNDTRLKLWNTRPPVRPVSLKAYVGKICRQLALDRYDERTAQRRGGGEVPLLLDELAECIPDGDDGRDFGESIALRSAIDAFLASLEGRTRRIFVRRYWYAASISEIAEEYGMKESAVAMLMLRTRKKLKEFLQKEGFEV